MASTLYMSWYGLIHDYICACVWSVHWCRHVYTFSFMDVYGLAANLPAGIYLCVSTHVHISLYFCMYTDTCIHVVICSDICMYLYIYIWVCIYIYVYIHDSPYCCSYCLSLVVYPIWIMKYHNGSWWIIMRHYGSCSCITKQHDPNMHEYSLIAFFTKQFQNIIHAGRHGQPDSASSRACFLHLKH